MLATALQLDPKAVDAYEQLAHNMFNSGLPDQVWVSNWGKQALRRFFDAGGPSADHSSELASIVFF